MMTPWLLRTSKHRALWMKRRVVFAPRGGEWPWWTWGSYSGELVTKNSELHLDYVWMIRSAGAHSLCIQMMSSKLNAQVGFFNIT